MRVTDSSWLVAVFNEGDLHHDEALTALREPRPIQVPAPILTETLVVIQRRQGKLTALAVLEALERLPHIVLLEQAPFAAAAAAFRKHAKLSLAEAHVLAAAQVAGATVLAFDKALLAAASAD